MSPNIFMKHPLDVDKPGPFFPAGAFAQDTEKAKWDLGHGLPPALCTLYEVPFSSGAMSGSITQSRGKFQGTGLAKRKQVTGHGAKSTCRQWL